MKRSIPEVMKQSVKNALLETGINRVLVGFSAGADSTTLLHLLHSIGVEIKALHCNFHLRGEESMRDEMCAREFCRLQGIPLDVVDFDVDGYIASKGGGISVEMACRDLRYAEFYRILESEGYQRIAVAHNLDDNVETLLLNLLRGSGVAGLKSMVADTGVIIRPLLKFTRRDIEQYIAEERLEYVSDSTNFQSDYKRNFLRNDVIKLIETRWPGAKKAISKSIENLQEEQRVLNWSKDYWLDGDTFLSLKKISQAPDAEWIIYQFASRYGATRDICREIAEVYKKKAGSQLIVGKRWQCGEGTLVFRMKGLEYLPPSSPNRYHNVGMHPGASSNDVSQKRIYHRKNIRISSHDYSGGVYFVTICTQDKCHYFGKIIQDKMIYTKIGNEACRCMETLASHYSYVEVPVFVVMPNHVHAIICINDNRDAPGCIPSIRTALGVVVGGYKQAITRFARRNNIDFGWQSRFHDHIIRDERDGGRITEYIENNVARWASDCFYK